MRISMHEFSVESCVCFLRISVSTWFRQAHLKAFRDDVQAENDRIAVLQNETLDGESGQRHGDDTAWHTAGQSSNGVEPSAGADTPGSGDRLSSGSPAETSSSPLHHQFPSPPPSASRNEVDLLRTQLRNESRRVRHLEELLQHRFSDVGNIREVRLHLLFHTVNYRRFRVSYGLRKQ